MKQKTKDNQSKARRPLDGLTEQQLTRVTGGGDPTVGEIHVGTRPP